jgi:hypothetical protein
MITLKNYKTKQVIKHPDTGKEKKFYLKYFIP